MPKHVAVLGLGVTGRSAIDYFLARGHTVRAYDSRLRPIDDGLLQQYPQVAFVWGRLPEAEELADCDHVLVSPGLSIHDPALASLRQVDLPMSAASSAYSLCTDIDLFMQAAKAPVIAVTGTNGKSTVVSLVAHLAKACGKAVAVGGNLGPPALALLADGIELYVLELSSFQLAWSQPVASKAATVLNISSDHQDWHCDENDYAAAKKKIYQACQYAVLNKDAPELWPDAVTGAASAIGFSLGFPDTVDSFGLGGVGGETWLYQGDQPLIKAAECPLRGEHQLANVLAALALGYAAGLDVTTMVKGLPSFEGLPHRCAYVGEFQGVHWYNDSKATNSGAMLAAIQGLAKQHPAANLLLIAGGKAKEHDFSHVTTAVASHVSHAMLFGEAASLLASAFASSCDCHQVDTLSAAVAKAAALAQPGDCVVLAPGCASFDQFRNFVARGEAFVQAVHDHYGEQSE